MLWQPPSGGCVLKPTINDTFTVKGVAAAFGRLCVETSVNTGNAPKILPQPPSGGCVLKRLRAQCLDHHLRAAAFGRLCVETPSLLARAIINQAAAFGRLCVETKK